MRATLLLEMRAVVPSPSTIDFINSLHSLENDTIDVRWLTDLSLSDLELECEELGIDMTGHSYLMRPEVKGSRKLSKSNDEYWWKFDAFKSESISNQFRRLLWIDPDISKQANNIDNWLDPLGVLEDDRLYLEELSDSILDEARNFFKI